MSVPLTCKAKLTTLVALLGTCTGGKVQFVVFLVFVVVAVVALLVLV